MEAYMGFTLVGPITFLYFFKTYKSLQWHWVRTGNPGKFVLITIADNWLVNIQGWLDLLIHF